MQHPRIEATEFARKESLPDECPFTGKSAQVPPMSAEGRALRKDNKPEFYGRLTRLTKNIVARTLVQSDEILDMFNAPVRPEITGIKRLQAIWKGRIWEQVDEELHRQQQTTPGRAEVLALDALVLARTRHSGAAGHKDLRSLLRAASNTATSSTMGLIVRMDEHLIANPPENSANPLDTAKRLEIIEASTEPLLAFTRSYVNTCERARREYLLPRSAAVDGAPATGTERDTPMFKKKNDRLHLIAPVEDLPYRKSKNGKIGGAPVDDVVVSCPILLTPGYTQKFWRQGVSMARELELSLVM